MQTADGLRAPALILTRIAEVLEATKQVLDDLQHTALQNQFHAKQHDYTRAKKQSKAFPPRTSGIYSTNKDWSLNTFVFAGKPFPDVDLPTGPTIPVNPPHFEGQAAPLLPAAGCRRFLPVATFTTPPASQEQVHSQQRYQLARLPSFPTTMPTTTPTITTWHK